MSSIQNFSHASCFHLVVFAMVYCLVNSSATQEHSRIERNISYIQFLFNVVYADKDSLDFSLLIQGLLICDHTFNANDMPLISLVLCICKISLSAYTSVAPYFPHKVSHCCKYHII